MTDAVTTGPAGPVAPLLCPSTSLRLLPWQTADGRPAYLSADGGFLAALADRIEEQQLDAAKDVLDLASGILDNPGATLGELRFAGRRLHESLRDCWLVAVSRGQRTPAPLRGTVAAAVRYWADDPLSVRAARHDLRQILNGWDASDLADTAELVLSELLTNALRYASSPSGLPVQTHYEHLPDGVRIEVHDFGSAFAVQKDPSDEAESGRGLPLVDALTHSRWGITEEPGPGKRVWAVVTRGAENGEG